MTLTVRFGRTLILALAILLLWAMRVAADDCLADPLNANDCLRTPGTAQVIAGVTAVVVTVLVNGQEVVQTILQPRDTQATEEAEGGEEQEPRQLQLQIDTRDESGASRTEINVGQRDRIYLYARCLQVGKGPLPAATQSIRFALTAGQGWVALSDQGMRYGSRIAAVDSVQPSPPGDVPEGAGVYVSATFEGESVGAPVTFTLASSQLVLEVT